MTLAELLVGAAADLPGVDVVEDGPGTSFLVGNTVIVAIGAAGAGEFRLDAAVAAAARRTPDTSASDRGPDWVRFAPISLDDHAADRAVAWLGFAARHAVEA